MMAASASRQRGAALLMLLAVLALGSSWYLISRLNSESGAAKAAVKVRNAQVLNQAKRALIGYIAAQANFAGENRPGAFPCPEAPADFNVSGSEGTVSYPCTLPIVGRFPWRTLGMDKLVDAYGEPLWYAVASGWAGAATVINSECASPSAGTGLACSGPGGRLTVDGVTNDVIALIIAPGPATKVTATAGCAAWTQIRTTVAPPDWRNYLECENASSPADATFVTTSTNSTFNDQLVTITVGDLIPALEASIANRIQREIMPALQTVYTPATWGFTGTTPVTSNPVLPFAAPFANPGPGAGTSDYVGAIGTYRGLLPFNQIGCTLSATNPRCTLPVYAKFGSDTKTAGSGSIRTQSTCSWQSNDFVCVGEYLQPSISVTVQIKAYVASGLRTTTQALPWTANSPVANFTFTAMNDTAGGWGTQNIPHTVTASALGSDGSITFTIAGGVLPDIATAGWGTYANYSVSINKAVFGDHALLDTANATTGWFAKNEWFRVVYYAVTPSNTANRLPSERACLVASGGPGDCLTVNTNSGTLSKSALLILAGRGINGVSRPSATLADYLEFGNVSSAYEIQTVTPKPASIYADTGVANAYDVAVASLVTGETFQFKAANTNTLTSTLNTTATGVRSLVNLDGSNLAASTIQANAAVQVTWDGTKFLLAKRPFNDRFAALNSN